MARQGRFELPTTGLEIRGSIQLSYWRAPGNVFKRLHLYGVLPEKISGTPGRRKFTRGREKDGALGPGASMAQNSPGAGQAEIEHPLSLDDEVDLRQPAFGDYLVFSPVGGLEDHRVLNLRQLFT